MMNPWLLLMRVGVVALVVAVVGVIAARAWYADDACPRAEVLCEVGSLGFGAVIVLGPAGALAVTIGGSGAWARRRRRASREG